MSRITGSAMPSASSSSGVGTAVCARAGSRRRGTTRNSKSSTRPGPTLFARFVRIWCESANNCRCQIVILHLDDQLRADQARRARMRRDLLADRVRPRRARQFFRAECAAGQSQSPYELAGAFHCVRCDYFIMQDSDNRTVSGVTADTLA